MNDHKVEPRGELKWWGIAASVLLHLCVVAAVFLSFSPEALKPEKQAAIQVQIVDPPKKKDSPKEKEAQKKKDAAKEKKQKEAEKKEPPPEPKKPEPKKKPAPEKKAEPPKPKAETPKAQQQASRKDTTDQPPLQVLQPVFRFGEKSGGPEKNETGNSATGEAKAATSSALDAGDHAAASKPDKALKANGAPVPDKIELPKADLADSTPKPGAEGAKKAVELLPNAVQNPPSETPKTAASASDQKKDQSDLKPAKTLFSQNAAGQMDAVMAMAGIPRAERISQLCTTELREQLRHASPPYMPALLPAYRLNQGTVLDIKNGAFRTRTKWYNLSYQCEVDSGATKVVSFAFRVGDAVPRDQWQARGFPE